MTYHDIRRITETDLGRAWLATKFISLADNPDDLLWIGGYEQEFDKEKREWASFVEAENANCEVIKIYPDSTELCVTFCGNPSLRVTDKKAFERLWHEREILSKASKDDKMFLKLKPLWTKLVEVC